MSRERDPWRGELVRLAAPEEGDAPIFARWAEDAEYLRALDTDYTRPMSVAEMGRWLEEFIHDPGTVEFRIRTVADDRLIGFVALHTIDWHHRTANLAIGIGEREDRGQGYGTEALRLVLRHAFREMNLERVGLNVHGDNAQAIRAYEKAGFRRAGIMRRVFRRDGQWQDRVIMDTLVTEWNGGEGKA